MIKVAPSVEFSPALATAALPTDAGEHPYVIFTFPWCLVVPPINKARKHNISTTRGAPRCTDVHHK